MTDDLRQKGRGEGHEEARRGKGREKFEERGGEENLREEGPLTSTVISHRDSLVDLVRHIRHLALFAQRFRKASHVTVPLPQHGYHCAQHKLPIRQRHTLVRSGTMFFTFDFTLSELYSTMIFRRACDKVAATPKR